MKKFFIQICDSGIMKYVGRLSLLFHDENPDRFRYRIELAKQRQIIAEDELRFLKYVSSLPDEQVHDLQEVSKKAILNKVVRRRRKDEEEYNVNSLANHINEVEKLYKLHTKKFNVIMDMKNAETNEKYQSSRIKMRERDESVPYYALFEKLEYPYADYFKKVANLEIEYRF
jgi:hypothetical protein